MLCLTALASSSSVAPRRVISVIRFDTIPISCCFSPFFINLTPVFPSVEYSVFASKSLRSLRGRVDLIFTLSFVGITTTVSPSKSAPDSLSATLEFIPTASCISSPKVALAFLFLLLTVRTGISKVPPWGYLTNATCSPFL